MFLAHLRTHMWSQSPPPQTFGNLDDALPFYRAYGSSVVDHYYTTDATIINSIILSANYALESVVGLVFVTEASTTPFYRLHNSNIADDFYTISTTARDLALQNGHILITNNPVNIITQTKSAGVSLCTASTISSDRITSTRPRNRRDSISFLMRDTRTLRLRVIFCFWYPAGATR
jgi:hypothetical protein